MLKPNKTKYNKQQKCINERSLITKGDKISFGEYGLKSLDNARITERQIESARIVISKFLKKGGKMWIRIFPDKPITKKPLEVRQGKGKGSVDHWVCVIQPGRILFEISGIPNDIAFKALKLAGYKLPVKTVCVKNFWFIK
jgi:large subunit ribosomal protein L16